MHDTSLLIIEQIQRALLQSFVLFYPHHLRSDMAVSSRVFIQVFLMILFSRIEVFQFPDFHGDYSGRSAHALKRVQRTGIAV